VRVGGWITGRSVLLSPAVVTLVSPFARTVYVSRTRAEVAEDADLSSDPPVSEQQRLAIMAQIPFPASCGAAGLWAGGYYALTVAGHRSGGVPPSEGDRHLQSARDVIGYAIAARDATFGCIADILLDDQTWVVRSVVASIRPWWSKRVVISRDAVRTFDWYAHMVTVDMWRETIEHCPTYRATMRQNTLRNSRAPGRSSA
jgi:hypothetical protein